jgi:HK97 family phage major capsid protein
MNRIQEIEARLAVIRQELETRSAELKDTELSALETEVQTLTEERAAIIAAAEKRNGILANIASGTQGTITNNPNFPIATNTAAAPQNVEPRSAPEYHDAFFHKLQGRELSEAEKRAIADVVGTAGEVLIPTQTANDIIAKVEQLAPIINETTLMHVKGALRFIVEGDSTDAVIHSPGTATDTGNVIKDSPNANPKPFVNVNLFGFEIIAKAILNDTMKTMSISSLESFMVNFLAEKIARQIENFLINGTGTAQPTGIEKANTWDDTNSVTAGASLTAANVQSLIGLLKAGYDRSAKFVMNKRTLFTDFMPLQDNSKNRLVTVEGGNSYYIYGYPVLLSDYAPAGTAYLGDLKKVVANLAEDINIKTAFDIDTNSDKYLGVAIFDCSPAIGEAFVKLSKAAAGG